MLCLALKDCDYFAVSMKRGELIVGHIPRGLSKRLAFSVVEPGACGTRGERRMTGEIFVTVLAFGVSYRFVGMIMTIPHGPGLKQNFFFVHTRCSNLL